MTREQANVRQKLIVGLVSAGLLGLSPVPQLRAQTPGSVKHSSTRGKKKTKARATTPNRKPAANRATSRNAARRGYRAGYRHGSYNGRYDARKSWRRWRAVTGLVALIRSRAGGAVTNGTPVAVAHCSGTMVSPSVSATSTTSPRGATPSVAPLTVTPPTTPRTSCRRFTPRKPGSAFTLSSTGTPSRSRTAMAAVQFAALKPP